MHRMYMRLLVAEFLYKFAFILIHLKKIKSFCTQINQFDLCFYSLKSEQLDNKHRTCLFTFILTVKTKQNKKMYVDCYVEVSCIRA